MRRNFNVFLVILTVISLTGAQFSLAEQLPLEPKDNTWELSVTLEDIGMLDIRGMRDIYLPDRTDELAVTLNREDLPPEHNVEAKRNDAVPVAAPRAEKYLYVIFSLKNLTQRPVMDPATNFPKVDAEGKVIYQYVPINTLRVVPDDTYLDVDKITEKIGTSIRLFLEMDTDDSEVANQALWPKRIDAIDVRLEQEMTAEEKVTFMSRIPYLGKFLSITSEYDLVLGDEELPETIPGEGEIRGVAFFGEVPKDIDQFSLYFSGISNRYRIKRDGKAKIGYYQRMVRFSFDESGDEFEISKDILAFATKERVYRDQYMGLHGGQRRIENWERERQDIESLGMTDPVEKWETEEAVD